MRSSLKAFDLYKYRSLAWILPGKGGGGLGPLPEVANLLIDYNADDFNLADNTVITGWLDSSGNGYDLPSITGAPTWRHSGLGDKPAVRFDGASIVWGSFAANILQPLTYFLVASNDLPSGNLINFFGMPTSTGPIHQLQDNSTNGLNPRAGSTYDPFTIGTINTTATLATIIFNGASSVGRLNGEVDAGVTTLGTEGAAGYRLGGDYLEGNFLTGYIARMLVYSRALNSGEINDVESWLLSYYSIV